MKRPKTKTIPELARQCAAPKCGKSIDHLRPQARTCSPACRKALWKWMGQHNEIPAKKIRQMQAKSEKKHPLGKKPRGMRSAGRRFNLETYR